MATLILPDLKVAAVLVDDFPGNTGANIDQGALLDAKRVKYLTQLLGSQCVYVPRNAQRDKFLIAIMIEL